MLPARPIERDGMLRRFGYDVENMTERSKSSAAGTMVKTHKLAQYDVPGTRALRYDLDQIEAVCAQIIPIKRVAA